MAKVSHSEKVDLRLFVDLKPVGELILSSKLVAVFFSQILFGIGISWIFCAIMTSLDLLPEGSPARTDLRLSVSS